MRMSALTAEPSCMICHSSSMPNQNLPGGFCWLCDDEIAAMAKPRSRFIVVSVYSASGIFWMCAYSRCSSGSCRWMDNSASRP